ncbi:hypothetical protein LP414_14255 [Polaromonas sp. P1(28)-13]|nr:hypothetical protein LP414_14255 [Polaromonas sp. P1(28)-13]
MEGKSGFSALNAALAIGVNYRHGRAACVLRQPAYAAVLACTVVFDERNTLGKR